MGVCCEKSATIEVPKEQPKQKKSKQIKDTSIFKHKRGEMIVENQDGTKTKVAYKPGQDMGEKDEEPAASLATASMMAA